jgi:hypothetical protein
MTALLSLLTVSAGVPSAPLLEGTWALEMRAVSASQVPILGDVRSVTTTVVLVRLEPTATGWTQHHLPCGSTIDGGALVKTRIPRAYFDSVTRKELTPQVRLEGDDVYFDVDLERFTGGWDPLQCDTVPSQIDSPCVRDWDADGKPGITIEVKAPFFPWAEVYVAQQTHPLLSGRMLGPDSIAGGLRVTQLDNRVLGSSNRLFHAQPKTRSVNDASTFRMERLPTDATCNAVLQHYALASL